MLDDEGASGVEDHDLGGLVDDVDVLPAHGVGDVEDDASGLDRSVRVDGRDTDSVGHAPVR